MRQIRATAGARTDIRGLLKASARMFGVGASRKYKSLINRALLALRENPMRAGVQQREDLPASAFLFHLRHARIRGTAPKHPRHIILFRHDDATLTILRVLHDAMDIERQAQAPGDD